MNLFIIFFIYPLLTYIIVDYTKNKSYVKCIHGKDQSSDTKLLSFCLCTRSSSFSKTLSKLQIKLLKVEVSISAIDLVMHL